jgi:hypothetical protein
MSSLRKLTNGDCRADSSTGAEMKKFDIDFSNKYPNLQHFLACYLPFESTSFLTALAESCRLTICGSEEEIVKCVYLFTQEVAQRIDLADPGITGSACLRELAALKLELELAILDGTL